MTVYWTSIEFDIVNPADYEDCIGGFVYLFLNVRDVQDAMPQIKKAIEEEDLRINHIEFVSPYDETKWDTQEDQILYDGLAKEAGNSDEIVWDQISAYESNDE
jgi:hypothetical protein